MVFFGFGSVDFANFRFVVVDDDVDCDVEEDANELLFDSIPDFVASPISSRILFTISGGTRTKIKRNEISRGNVELN